VHGLGEFPLGVYVEGWWCGGWLGVCGVFVDWASWGGLRAVGRLAIFRGGPSQADTTDWGSLQGPWSGSRDCSEH